MGVPGLNSGLRAQEHIECTLSQEETPRVEEG